jgi:hypothetical protein
LDRKPSLTKALLQIIESIVPATFASLGKGERKKPKAKWYCCAHPQCTAVYDCSFCC